MNTLPAQAGIGLRSPHIEEVIATRPRISWLEVHSENYFCAGGPPLRQLATIREHYPLSLHGVGLSLGSSDALDLTHLRKLKTLIDLIEPAVVSEHLCWSSIGGRFLNDLLPLPYSEEALDVVCHKIQQTQEFLGRRVLIENVSSYVRFRDETMTEWDFLAEVAQRSDCDILLDVNNIFVSASNHGYDATRYLDAMPQGHIREIHLAGHEEDADENGEDLFLVDTHSRPIADPVWALYAQALQKFGPIPTLIEWDSDIPPLAVLLCEAAKAEGLLLTHTDHARAA